MFLLILRTACRPEGWEQQVSVQTLSDRMMEDTAGLVPEGPMWGCSVLAWKQATGRFSGSSSTEAIFDKVELRCGAWLHCKAETIWRQGLRARPLELNNMNRYCWGRKQKKISRNRGSWDKRSLRLCHRRHHKRLFRESVRYSEGLLQKISWEVTWYGNNTVTGDIYKQELGILLEMESK